MPPEIQSLLQTIETRLDWGPPAQWQSRDFDNLSEHILDKTGVSLSPSTLKRLWGRARYTSAPSGATLEALARFAGYEGYRAFVRARGASSVAPPSVEGAPGPGPTDASGPGPTDASRPDPTDASRPAPAVGPRAARRWPRLLLAGAFLAVVALAATLAFRRKAPHKNGPFHFGSRTVVGRGIPNSVVFHYDAPVGPGDSVFIQQSWDPRRRERVDPAAHVHTSVYYRPGFFRAKLVVDTQVVAEHALMVASDGWLGLIDHDPVPIYLAAGEFLRKDMLRLPPELLTKKVPETRVPHLRFLNVGNFEPVPVPALSFSAEVYNEYGRGEGACRITDIYLMTDDGIGTLYFPVAMKGCVSDLGIYCVDHGVSGKDADLSGLGLDSAGWATVACRATGGNMEFLVNGHIAYTTPLPKRAANVVGVEFIFQGTGAVRGVRLEKSGRVVLSAF